MAWRLIDFCFPFLVLPLFFLWVKLLNEVVKAGPDRFDALSVSRFTTSETKLPPGCFNITTLM